ncbi:MAG: DUF488 family protein [Candidatus Zixiibacteriota bacterium]
MLQRQKILLGLLLCSEVSLSKLKLVKLAFLLKNETIIQKDNTFYDFIPYKYGPFSFTLYHELDELRNQGFISTDKLQVNMKSMNLSKMQFNTLSKEQRYCISKVLNKYGKLTDSRLIQIVYSNYPWFAIRSELNHHVNDVKIDGELKIYTAGYEENSIDFFFQKLLKFGIRRLVDVRRNPISRKKGFSKGKLSEYCNKMGIEYIHFRELGVPSDLRVSLNSFEDYQKVLKLYDEEILPQKKYVIDKVTKIINKEPTVIVCFEKDHNCCHRSRLAKVLSEKTSLEIQHI